MSNKMGFMTVPGRINSETSNVLGQIIGQNQSNKEFALRERREDRRDALARARMNLQDKRYEQGRADKKQADLDALRGSVDELSIDPISYEGTKDIDETFETGDTAKEYDVKAIQAAYEKDPTAFDTKQIEPYETKQIDPKNQVLKDAYDVIQANPNLTTKDAKDDAMRSWMADNGYKDMVEGEDNLFTATMKNLGRYGARVDEYANMIGEIGTGLMSPQLGRDYERSNIERNRRYNEFYKIEDPIGFAKDRIKTLKAKESKNKEIEALNKKNIAIEKGKVQDKLKTFETGKKVKVTDTRKKTVAREDKEIKFDIAKKAKDLADAINKRKDLTEKQKLYKLRGVAKSKTDALKEHNADKKKAAELKKWRREEQAKINLALTKEDRKDERIILQAKIKSDKPLTRIERLRAEKLGLEIKKLKDD